MSEPRVILSGLGIPESPRWHEGRLWFCNWIDRQVMAVDLDGTAEVMLSRDPASHPMGYGMVITPDGRTLVISESFAGRLTAFDIDGDGALSGRRVFAEGLAENRAPFALMLGGPDRRTLFILTAEWRLADDHVVNLDRLANGPRTGEILTLTVDVPGAGRP